MNSDLLHARVRDALRAVPAPGTGTNIVDAGLVRGLVVKDGRVGFTIEPAEPGPSDPALLAPVRARAQAAAEAVPGVAAVTAVLTAHAEAPAPSPGAPRTVRVRKGARLSDAASAQATPAAPPARPELPGVARVLAVASGKGGVGKSTLAVNLACAFAADGARVGLLDADVYGPSVPMMMGLGDAEPQIRPDKKLEPPTAFGVKVMSIGFLVDADTAMIWRGPIVMSALTQMMNDVAWAPLDVLVIDLPPGTGDAQLTLVQRAPLSGAVIVSTPQEVALADVRRGVRMFERTHVPVLGVVENMSAARNPDGSVAFAPFGAGGARRAAEEMGAPFLGAVPIDPALAAASDAGRPPAAAGEDTQSGAALRAIARTVRAALAAEPERVAPRIVFA